MKRLLIHLLITVGVVASSVAATPIVSYVQLNPPNGKQIGGTNISTSTVTDLCFDDGSCQTTAGGGSGSGPSGQINTASQFSAPYYSVTGSSNVLSGSAVSIYPSSMTAGSLTSTALGNNPYAVFSASGTSQAIQVNVNGNPSGGAQNQIGGVTINGPTDSGNTNSPALLVIKDSTTNTTNGAGLLEIWENNPNHNSYLLWIHGDSPRNSDEPIRFDGPTFGIDEVSASTDSGGAHGLGKWKVISEGFGSVQSQIVSPRAWDNSTFENLLYATPFTEPGVQPAGIWLNAQSLTNDSAVLSSSDTSVYGWQTQNNHTVGLTAPLNPAASWTFALPSTFNNQNEILYQSDNGRGNNNNARSWAFSGTDFEYAPTVGVTVSTITASSVTIQNITINGTCTGSGCGGGSVVLQSSGVAFGSASNTVISDTTSFSWTDSTKDLHLIGNNSNFVFDWNNGLSLSGGTTGSTPVWVESLGVSGGTVYGQLGYRTNSGGAMALGGTNNVVEFWTGSGPTKRFEVTSAGADVPAGTFNVAGQTVLGDTRGATNQLDVVGATSIGYAWSSIPSVPAGDLEVAGTVIASTGQFTNISATSFSGAVTYSSNVVLGNGQGSAGQVFTSQAGGVPTWTTPSGGGASSLAVTTGTAAGFSSLASSPTAVINFDNTIFTTALKGSATGYVSMVGTPGFLGTNQVWTAPNTFTSSTTNTSGGGENVTFGIIAGSYTVKSGQGQNTGIIFQNGSTYTNTSTFEWNGTTMSATGVSSPRANITGIAGSTITYSSATFTNLSATNLNNIASAAITNLNIVDPTGTHAVVLAVPTLSGNTNFIFPSTQGTSSTTLINDGTGTLSWGNSSPAIAYRSGTLGSSWDGGGSVLTTGTTYWVRVSTFSNYVLDGFTLTGTPSGSLSVFVSSSSVFNAAPVSICASQCPTFTTTTSSSNYTLGGWQTTINAGGYIYFMINTAATVTQANLAIDYYKP